MSTIRSVVNIFGNIAANWFFISWRVHSAVFGHRYWFIVTHFAVSMAAFKVSFLFVDSQTLPQPNLICSELRRNWFFFSLLANVRNKIYLAPFFFDFDAEQYIEHKWLLSKNAGKPNDFFSFFCRIIYVRAELSVVSMQIVRWFKRLSTTNLVLTD